MNKTQMKLNKLVRMNAEGRKTSREVADDILSMANAAISRKDKPEVIQLLQSEYNHWVHDHEVAL